MGAVVAPLAADARDPPEHEVRLVMAALLDGVHERLNPPAPHVSSSSVDEERQFRAAAENGRASDVADMVERGRVNLNGFDIRDRCSALHLAAANGHARVVELLCGAGARVDDENRDGYTPYQLAVGHSTLITHQPSTTTHHPPPITHHPPPITHHPSPITHHPSPITPNTRV